MIDETLQDQAALHALGMLQGDELTAFQTALAGNAELQTMVDEIAESAAGITHALPSTKAPAEVLPRLLAQIRAERMHGPVQRVPETDAESQWMPWAMAASIAVAATVGFLSGSKVNAVRTEKELARLGSEIEQSDTERKRLTSIVSALKEERLALDKRVETLRHRDAISQLLIATLKVQKSTLEKAYTQVVAYVVWDATGQTGMMRFENLPPAAPGMDYQMWVIDPRYDAPVSAGVFSAGTDKQFEVRLTPTRQIAKAGTFAVSLEQKGGSVAPKGPIVFMTN